MPTCPVCAGHCGEPKFHEAETAEITRVEREMKPVKTGWRLGRLLWDLFKHLTRR